MPWFLYLIECADGSLYTGIATDVEARFAKHASGKGARYTRSRKPVACWRRLNWRGSGGVARRVLGEAAARCGKGALVAGERTLDSVLPGEVDDNAETI